MTQDMFSKNDFNPKSWLKTARTLTEALPFLQRYNNKRIIIKYGGHAMGSEDRSIEFARDMTLIKQCNIHPIIVHGGGPQIQEMLDKLNIPSHFINGLRVTSPEAMKIIQMVLAGSINKDIVAMIGAQGGHAVGISGKDGHLIEAVQFKPEDPETKELIDLGMVGTPRHVNTKILEHFNQTDMIPVISPIGADRNGQAYNINADTAAGSIAQALQAERLLLLTDVAGVKDKEGKVISNLSVTEAKLLISKGVIHGGMIPKIETAIYAIENGVKGVVILDGRAPHAVLLELFTAHGAGTLVYEG